MSLLIAMGSNLGNRVDHLEKAKETLNQYFKLLAESQIYHSPAVDYENQPDFLNQVLEFELPQDIAPDQAMELLLKTEKKMGRIRHTPKGPRVIDLDILFWADAKINQPNLQIPHPRLFERSFVVRPLQELPYYDKLKQKYHFTELFSPEAFPLSTA